MQNVFVSFQTTCYNHTCLQYTFFYKQFIFDPRPENCLSFSKKSPQKIVWQLFSSWSINFCLNIQTSP